jgi:peptide-methionine (R)-S-oxide reductase
VAARRQFLAAVAGAMVIAPVAIWFARPSPAALSARTFPVQKTDEDWKRALTGEQYRVLRGHATERRFSSALDREKSAGTFVCAGCGRELFSSRTKFDSGTGWPSFWEPLAGGVGTSIDKSWLMVRTEVHCANCGGHLGHVFNDGPPPSGLRYCINGVALKFVPEERH